MFDILHLENVVITPAHNRPCAVRPDGQQRCSRPAVVDFEYTIDGGRWGIVLCAECFRLIMLPYLPETAADGTPTAALLAVIEGGLQ
jgi:hypothetical protein